MNNLVIIGNGFDLAHGLKSSYTDFIKHVIDSQFKDSELFEDLIVFKGQKYNYKTLTSMSNYDLRRLSDIEWRNAFFFKMVSDIAHSNWCDIEKLYYNELLNSKNKDPKTLNDQFEIIKSYLEEYLELEKNRFVQIPSYNGFFRHLKNAERTFVLNFNYTDTVRKYDGNNSNLNIVNIHGELKNENNPIIFGFAADDVQSRLLIDKDNKEYMRNIKKHCYKRTKNQNKLIDYLETTKKIDVLILGHSCGISDKLILNQIFNHENISTIRIFYHENHEKYFETQVNIDRIMNNDKHFKKLLNFEESYKMPQYTDAGLDISNFDRQIVSLLDAQKVKRPGYVF